MAKVQSPQGEEILVRRRWFPWPNFTQDQLEEWGVSDKAARILGGAGHADLILAGLLAFFPIVFLLSGFTTIAFVLIFLIAATFVTCYLALPWRIEVVHKTIVVESEKSDGYSQTSARIEKVAALYRSGALKLPSAPKNPVPEKVSQVPVQTRLPEPEAPVEPEAPKVNIEVPQAVTAPAPVREKPEAPLSSSLPTVFAPVNEPLLPIAPSPEPVQAMAPAFTGESPLRRAIRLMEEEEKELERRGVKKDHVDAKLVNKAKPSKPR